MKNLYPTLLTTLILSIPQKPTQAFPARIIVFFAALLLAGAAPCRLFAQSPAITYSSPQVYQVNVPITPLTPANSGGAVAAPTGAYGSPVILGSGLTFPQNGMALDAAGNMYVNDQDAVNGNVKKITADGSSTTIIGSGFLSQSGNVAVDKAGNVFVADQARVWKIPASGSPVTYGTPVVLNNTFSRPFSIAVDTAGNVYVTDLSGGGGVFKMANDGTNKTKIDNGITNGSGIAVDAAGNVYVVDFGALALYKIPANGNPQVQLASGFGFPRGLAVDAAGYIYVDDGGNGVIYKVSPGGGTPVAVISGLSNNVGVAIDPSNNLYVALQGSAGANKFSPTGGYFISPALPAGLSFDNTTGIISGTPTLASPATDYTVSGFNLSGGSATIVNIKVFSSDASLTALTTTANSFAPAFNSNTTSGYTASVPNATTSVTVTPTAGYVGANIQVRVNSGSYTAVTTGTASGPLALHSGNNTIDVKVTSNDGTNTKTYTLTVHRALSSNAVLGVFATTPKVTLTVVPGAYYKNYEVTVNNSVNSIRITPTAQDSTASITVKGAPVASGSASDPIQLNVDTNTIYTTVTAEDGVTKKTYAIKITRLPSTNAVLSAFATTPKTTLTAVSGADYKDYEVTVSNSTSAIRITPTAQDTTASITVKGVPVASGTASDPIQLLVDTNTIFTTVTAQDGVTKKTYAIKITRLPSSNAVLSAIATTPTTKLTAVPGTDYRDYEATVSNLTTSISIVPTGQDATATITVNGATVTSGTASDPIHLNVDTNTIFTTVTAQDGVTKKTYAIKITRLPSTNAVLSAIATTPSTKLTAVPGTDYKDYEATVSNSISSISIVPTGQDATATITVNGATVASGTASDPIHLNVDTNTIFTTVTAQDGVTKKTYAIKITRLPSSNAVLSAIATTPTTKLTAVPGTDYRDYEATVSNLTTSIRITPTTQDGTAILTVNGATVISGVASDPIQLNVDTNTIYTTVTAQDGVTKKTYAIKVTRLPSTNAVLSGIATTPTEKLTTVAGTNYRNYETTVSNSTSSIRITPTAQDVTATITVNGAAVASGAASNPILLHVDTNTIYTTVTAQDGITQKTYAIKVTRLPSTNAVLAVLTTTPTIHLTTVTGTHYKDYTSTIANSISAISISATTQDATATLTVNGAGTTPGTASGPVQLNADTTTIFTTVTAQDGITKKTYAILVTRQPPGGLVMKYEEQASPIVNEAIAVHQNVSPNGDGKGDALVIEGIAAHPDNKLQIMSRNGALVYEVKGYDNGTKAFDGHSSTNGKLQQPGTYFYSLEYKDGNEVKHKTGFIVLKY